MLLPIGLLSVIEIGRRIRHRPVVRRHDALFWVVLSVIGFVVVKVSPAGNYAYAWAIGAMRWPLQAVSHAGGAVHLRPIVVSRDLADLVALVFSPVPFLLIRNRIRASVTAARGSEDANDHRPGGGRALVDRKVRSL